MLNILLSLKIIILSFVQSVTEFLPISSTTHLIFFDNFLNSGFAKDDFFMIIIQLGSLFALFSYYKKDIWMIFKNTVQLKKEGYIVAFNLFNAFIISALLGFLIKENFIFDYKITALSLIILGIFMILIRKKEISGMIYQLDRISSLNAFFIGALQALSAVPGVSRLGITMIAGLFFNLSKENAIRFSFLLGLPTMFCASFYQLGKLIWKNQIIQENIPYYILAFFSSLLIALILIKFLMCILHKTPLKFFGYYRIMFALIIILFFVI